MTQNGDPDNRDLRDNILHNEAAGPQGVSRADVASGAGMAAMARMGALIEIIAQPAYVWMFGLGTYGVYIVLWAAINLLATILSLSMQQALQRVVPAMKSDLEAIAAVKFAIAITVIPALFVALIITLFATPIAAFFSAGPMLAIQLPQIIQLFAWTLPFLLLLEIATAAARAKRAFGPEIRLRIFWEQLTRLGFAVLLFAIGQIFFGLFIAHILSLVVTAILSLRLLARYYDIRAFWHTPLSPALRRDILASGFATLPPNLVRRIFNDLPPVILNITLAGQAGAVAAGLYGIARKVASVPLIVRQAFLYVLAPLSSAQKAVDPLAIAPLYHFANRLAVIIVVPLSVLMILIGEVILRIFAPEAIAALPVLIILVIGRAGESILGAATPIVEMTGHRGLPLINSVTGLMLAAALAYWLVPDMGATGMAIAVASGVTLASWAAVVELRVSDNLNPFDRQFWFAFAAACGLSALLYAIGVLFSGLWPFTASTHIATAVLHVCLFFPVLFLALKYGLEREDKAALGPIASRLGI